MNMLRPLSAAKRFVPRRGRFMKRFVGSREFASFEEAKLQSHDGYENTEIIDAVVLRTREAALGGTLNGRTWSANSQLISQAGLVSLATRGVRDLAVLDVGGAAGIHYYVTRQLMPHAVLRWAIVETPGMAEACMRNETENLKWFVSLEAAYEWLGDPDLAMLGSSLQYFEHPLVIVEKVIRSGAQGLLITRTPVTGNSHMRFFSQRTRVRSHGPSRLPHESDPLSVAIPVSVPTKRDLEELCRSNYSMVVVATEAETSLGISDGSIESLTLLACEPLRGND